MMTIEEALANLGDRITDVIGVDIYNLLKEIGEDQTDQEKLVRLAIDIHTEVGILRDKKIRDVIFNSLKKDDARTLAMVIGLEYPQSPYKALRECRFRKGSKKELNLFTYFDVEIPVKVEDEKKETVEEIIPKYGLFRHQRDALIKIEDVLENDGGRVVLHMPTGSGKTRTAMNLAAKHLNREESLVLWLAHSEELCEQAADEFQKAWSFLGDRDVTMRRFYKSHEWEDTNDGIIIAGLDKMWSYVKRTVTGLQWAASNISMVIFDEAHQSIAPTYELPIEIITTKNPRCKFLGLTATPGRTWKDISEDERLSDFYNRKKVTLEVEGYNSPISYLVEEGYLSEPDFKELKYDGGPELSLEEKRAVEESSDYNHDILKELSKSGLRNSLILERIRKLVVNEGHQRVLVFAINVHHARTLSTLLNFSGVRSDVVTGDTDQQMRARAISTFKEPGGEPMVLCNYGVLTTGFDAPRTSAAVIARPTKSLVLYSQMVGRVIRGPKVGGTDEAEIWTVVDTHLPGFNSLTDAFTNWEDVWG
jgi:superfamily II DNA or RNA helicase